ncbi:TPA: PAAR domain-containing protein [Klebsiella pneumoniae]|nr:PAAR domain-containing protein [Klebsiella pneumoniae]
MRDLILQLSKSSIYSTKPPTTIIEGNSDYLDHGIPVAFHGHKCACGCTLISSFAAAKVA